VSIKANFVSPSTGDLHLQSNINCSLDNLGTVISGVTTDYDAATRSASTPDIGADEYTRSDTAPGASLVFNNPAGTSCAGATTALGSPCLPMNDNTWHDITDANGNVLASINPNGSNLGTVSVAVYQYNDASQTNLTGFSFNHLGKVWNISATGSITSGNEPAIRLYYKATDQSALNTASNCGTCTGQDIVVAQSSGITEDCDPTNNTGQTLNLYWFKNAGNYSNEAAMINNHVTGTANLYGSNKTATDIGYTQTNQSGFDGSYIQINKIPSFSEFRFTQGQIAPLPLVLLDFKATRAGADAVLDWSAGAEDDIDRYEIEQSTNGSNYSKLATVTARRSGVAVNSYVYRHVTPGNGMHYYRIRMIDFNGKSIVSQTRSIDFRDVPVTAVSWYPNPVSDVLHFTMHTPDQEQVSVTITDLAGKIVFSQTVSKQTGAQQFALDMTGLPSGAYFARLTGSSSAPYTFKFVKQ
jgi:hypothetical protein